MQKAPSPSSPARRGSQCARPWRRPSVWPCSLSGCPSSQSPAGGQWKKLLIWIFKIVEWSNYIEQILPIITFNYLSRYNITSLLVNFNNSKCSVTKNLDIDGRLYEHAYDDIIINFYYIYLLTF